MTFFIPGLAITLSNFRATVCRLSPRHYDTFAVETLFRIGINYIYKYHNISAIKNIFRAPIALYLKRC